MNRAEYMKELAYLLQGLPDEEREEALQYYENYFDDAGEDQEEAVIAELGRPEKIAAIIREGVQTGYGNQDAEYTETGYWNERYRDPHHEVAPPGSVRKKKIGMKTAGSGVFGGTENGSGDDSDASYRSAEEGGDYADASYRSAEGGGAYTDASFREAGKQRENEGHSRQEQNDAGREKRTARPKRNARPLLWLLILAAAVCAAPFLLGGAALLLGAAVVVICVIGGISLAVLLITVVLLAAGVILIGLGIGKLFTFPIAGMMIGGIGLAVLAFGMLFLWLTVLVCGKAVPGVIHMIGNFFSFLSGKLRRGGARA